MMGDSRNGKDDKWRREEQLLKLVRPVKVEILRRGMPVAVLAQVFDCCDILRLVWCPRDTWLMLAEYGGGGRQGLLKFIVHGRVDA